MTKEEILQSSDSKIAYTIISQIFDEMNTKYLEEDLSDEDDLKMQGYLDGLKFCLDIISKTSPIKEGIKNESNN